MLTYLYIAICVVAETLQHMLYRMAGRSPRRYMALVSAGVSVHVIEQVFWYLLLSREKLGIVLPLTGATYATVAMVGSMYFGEKLTPRRKTGIALIMVGFVLIAPYLQV